MEPKNSSKKLEKKVMNILKVFDKTIIIKLIKKDLGMQ